jgi:hypothetical protein
MSAKRLVEYTNPWSNGPVGFEYLLPLDSEGPADLSPWMNQFAKLEPEEVFATLSRRWTPINSTTRPLVEFFATLRPASIYVLPDEDCPYRDWLLLKSPSHVFFFTEPSPIPQAVTGFEKQLVLLLNAFNGVRIGFRMDDSERFLRQDSGFVSAANLHVLTEADDWFFREGEKEAFRGWLLFFDTPCGNRFLASPSGEIVKWSHDFGETKLCFQDVFEFVTAFTAFYCCSDRRDDSPFVY